jgi:hypothetical protein
MAPSIAEDDDYHSENDRPDNDNEDLVGNVEANNDDSDEEKEDDQEMEEDRPLAGAFEAEDFEISETPLIQTRTGAPNQAESIEKPTFMGTGPVADVPAGTVSPLDFLRLFLDDVAMTTLVSATNAYAASVQRNVHSRRWPPLTVKELWAFFSIILVLGTINVRYRRSFWDRSSKYYNTWVASAMECGRFEDILFCLHWVNTADVDPVERRNVNRQDPFWAVTGFLEHLRGKFQEFTRSTWCHESETSCHHERRSYKICMDHIMDR